MNLIKPENKLIQSNENIEFRFTIWVDIPMSGGIAL